MKVVIASDHAGFSLKQNLREFLEAQNFEVVDVGADSATMVDYPDYAEKIGLAIVENEAMRGVLICGSGVGASIAANKIPGVRAGLCYDTYSAHQGVEHDAMNVLVLGARIIGVELAYELVRAFLAAEFTNGERHLRRLEKVHALERRYSTKDKIGEIMDATTKTQQNPLKQLAHHGQSPWLDYIRRDLFTTGELKRLIEEDGLKGMTSNPAIFEKAIGSEHYKDSIAELALEKGASAVSLYEKLAIQDIQTAADALRVVYDATDKRDGYVSLEVSPALADDSDGTLEEARRLWKAVDRPNLMVKVPATAVGFDTIKQLIGEGININVTLLFAQESYRKVAEAFVAGLEKRAAENKELSGVASVASFFVSRIDSLIDSQIEEKLKTASGEDKQLLSSLLGKIAIANAKMAYEIYEEIFSGTRWEKLSEKGAQTQRVLWASTGTKNEKYSDVLYIEELIGKDTVNTIPPATWDAFRDHGKLRESLTENVEGARETLANLEKAGISLEAATDKLLIDAVRLFVEPFDKMIAAVESAIGENKK